jgi:hypothetical protein
MASMTQTQARALAEAVEQDEPFFLVGSERSGTTLLRLMLSHHGRIECAPEFEFLVEELPPQGGWPDLEHFRDWLSTNRIFLPHGLAVDPQLDYPELVKSFLSQYVARSGKPIHGATCHKHFDRLLRVWPRARFVHLLRDGRDVARSCIGMGWAGNVWYGAQRWIDAQDLWAGLEERLDASQHHELRYEDLIRDPQGELTRLCAFLGTEYDPAMLDYAQDSSYDRPDPKLIAQWRRKLSPAELGLLEGRIGARLREAGYEESGVPATRPGPLGRLALWAQDRWARLRFRYRRYGLALLVRSRLANLLGIASWKRAVTLARNEIDNRHLQ